jgi:RNA polymerase-binding transcription factor DksA
VPDATLQSELRAQLEDERGRLRAQILVLDPSSDAHPSYDENFADSGQVAAELGENKALLASLRDQLADVERALSKLESGKYGLCERCGEAIADARLEAMPATRYCIQHA